MVEAAGAMAMFVLRLAGILSLENSIKEQEANLTDSQISLTDSQINLTDSHINLTQPHINLTEPHINLTELHINLTNPHTNLTSLRFISSTSNLSRSSQDVLPHVSLTAPLSPVEGDSLSLAISSQPTTTPTLGPTTPTLSTDSIKLSRIKESQTDSFLEPSSSPSHNEIKISTTSTSSSHDQNSKENEEIAKDSIEMLPSASPLSNVQDYDGGSETNKNESQPIHNSDSRPIRQSEELERRDHQGIILQEVQDSVRSLGHEDVGDAGEDNRGRATPGRSSETSAVAKTKVRKKETTQKGRSDAGRVIASNAGGNVSGGVKTVGHNHATNSPPTVAPAPTPTPSARSRLRLEALVEDDDMSGLIDAPRLADTQRFADLEAPAEGFIESDLEYYDFGTYQQIVTPNPTLSSLSLVSAVPVRPPSRPPESRRQHRTRKPAPARPRKVPPGRPVRPVHHQRPPLRNNPYPYGPKILPGPYAPLAHNLPTARENGEEYNYEEDLEYYYDPEDNEESKYEVQTREPPVLFVFDKPGYSPEPPTTMVPPTRAPTPSDPWDCIPRCPRYTNWMSLDTMCAVSGTPAHRHDFYNFIGELEDTFWCPRYFYGLNDQGLVLNLTVPFMTQIKFGKHPGVLEETNDYTVSLYVQPSYYQHSDLPTPISNEVLVDELESKTVFVHSFEANVWDVTESFLQEKVQTLMEQLRHNGEAFLDRYYYLASYSRPELYQRVYYEIWIYATNFRDPQTNVKSSNYNRKPQTNKITQKTLNKLCRGVECPKFEVLRTYKYGIQKRRYYHGLFASTSPRECEFTTMSVWKGFMPLHLYKHGVNSHMEVIEATRPIALVHIRDSTDPDTECPQNLTMSLYLPQRLHSNPPVTGYAAPSVHITDLDDVIVYAYTVGGYLLDPIRVRKELSDMKYRLSEFGACYKDDEHYVVIYDFIVRYHGRQNEIWIVAENCKATHNG
nr:uncharacterized protein LOC128699064 [Cherax quadricarinatus]